MWGTDGRAMLTACRKEVSLHVWMDGWDWLWMSFMMVFWLVVLGAVIYVAVRLAKPAATRTQLRRP
jgi:hypothetical protein